jgi:uncharacterized cysteine cluster protein YcgN (CxxCxxCC family)
MKDRSKLEKDRLDQEWEDRCRRCGRCCYEKIEFEGEVFYTDIPCEKLDLATCLCTVYKNRHMARPGCGPLTPENIAGGILPADCPYVADILNYRAPRLREKDGEP